MDRVAHHCEAEFGQHQEPDGNLQLRLFRLTSDCCGDILYSGFWQITTRRILTRILCAVTILAITVAPVGRAELANQDRKHVKKMMKGPLYLCIDAPCRHDNLDPLLEVAPTGANTERRINAAPEKKGKHIFLRLGPNDVVREGSAKFKKDTVRLWLEGARPNSDELMIEFVRINTMDDFMKAFERTFSKTPLQDLIAGSISPFPVEAGQTHHGRLQMFLMET